MTTTYQNKAIEVATEIWNVSARFAGIDPDDINLKKSRENRVLPYMITRQVIAYLIKKHIGWSDSVVAKFVGNKNHCSSFHSTRVVNNYLNYSSPHDHVCIFVKDLIKHTESKIKHFIPSEYPFEN